VNSFSFSHLKTRLANPLMPISLIVKTRRCQGQGLRRDNMNLRSNPFTSDQVNLNRTPRPYISPVRLLHLELKTSNIPVIVLHLWRALLLLRPSQSHPYSPPARLTRTPPTHPYPSCHPYSPFDLLENPINVNYHHNSGKENPSTPALSLSPFDPSFSLSQSRKL
jgi:hypothetical protein